MLSFVVILNFYQIYERLLFESQTSIKKSTSLPNTMSSGRFSKPPNPQREDRALKKQPVAVFSEWASRRVEGPLTPEGGIIKVNIQIMELNLTVRPHNCTTIKLNK